MGYDHRPLYPPQGGWNGRDNCVRMPLFGGDKGFAGMDSCGKTVCLENPCCPGEYAEVVLSVDGCGNLVVCVRRDGSCRCRERKPCRY